MNDEKKAMPKTKSFVKSEAEKQTKKTEQTAIVEKVVEKVDMVKKSSIHLIPTTSEEEETFILKVTQSIYEYTEFNDEYIKR